MLLNGAALNSTPLNGLTSSAAAPVVPAVPIAQGLAFRWRLRVMVGDVDMSARLTGGVTTDRERRAAGVANFVLQLAPGPVLPSEWVGRTVQIYYLSTAQGIATETLRYSGRIVKTEWSSQLRQLACQCGDQLQQRVEALEIAQINALTYAAYWSADVFEPVAGRSRWDYAQERLSTMAASLDSAPDGTLRVSSWYAGPPDFEFGANTTIYDSLSVSYADLTSLTNTVEIEASYRFSRLWQWDITYAWAHPDTAGLDGIQGFCVWRHNDTELPTVEMIESAAQKGGATLVSATYNRLPPSGIYCDPPSGWINSFPDLLLGASWVAARRWVQSVTQMYALTVVADASVAQAGAVIARDSIAVDASRDDAQEWADALSGGATGELAGGSTGGGVGSVGGTGGSVDVTGLSPGDLIDEPRRAAAITCRLYQAATSIIAAHTATQVSWETPTSMVMAVDLTHTLKIDDQGVKAQAKCSRILDRYDLLAGTAITTLSIAVMRGGGALADPLIAPVYAAPAKPDIGDGPAGYNYLPTQLGSLNSSPVYDDDTDGFAGNYTINDLDINAGLAAFPRRFTATAPEIPAIARDEQTTEYAARYRVVIPDDLLEL